MVHAPSALRPECSGDSKYHKNHMYFSTTRISVDRMPNQNRAVLTIDSLSLLSRHFIKLKFHMLRERELVIYI